MYDGSNYKSLWASVILQAIADMDNSSEGLGAKHYILNSRESGEGSIEWICSILDLDLNKLRMMCSTREGRKNILNSALGTMKFTIKSRRDKPNGDFYD